MEITFYRKLANKVAEVVVSNHPYSEEESRRIRYGLICIFSDMYKLLLYLVIFAIFSLTKQYLIALIGVVVLRPYLGGFHAKNEITCIFISFFYLLLSILLGRLDMVPQFVQIGVLIIFPAIGAIISPVRVNKVVPFNIKIKITVAVLTVALLLLDMLFIKGQIVFWAIVFTYILAVYQYFLNRKTASISIPT